MLVIRLSRAGAKKRPYYHIVVADKRSSRDGRFVERLGHFNPIAAGQAVRLTLNLERAQHWLAQGAQPSDRVNQLIKNYQQTAQSTDTSSAA